MPAAASSGLNVTPRGDREIVMTRVFSAPRRLVFDAVSKPELFVRWFGPRGWSVPVCEMDLRPGGAYHYVLRRADGTEFSMRGEYRAIEPPERLVYTEAFEGFSEAGWRPEDATVVTLVLTEQDGQTTWTATSLYPSQAVRDAAIQSKEAWVGAVESFERLAEVLTTLFERNAL
jgi:uncharacterized protein YndB with AHSA1/START domain